MPFSMSKAAVNRLGERLAASPEPTPPDLAALSELQRAHQQVLEQLKERLAETFGRPPSFHRARLLIASRVKTVNTLLDKVRKQSRLSSIQDVAGARIVAAPLIPDGYQDALVQKVQTLLDEPKVIDRRAQPSQAIEPSTWSGTSTGSGSRSR